MAQVIVHVIDGSTRVVRDDHTGIAWVEDGRTGNGHSCHPTIDASGSIRGMKAQGYWDRDDKTVRSGGFIYNISRYQVSHTDGLAGLAAKYCRCGGNHDG